MAALTKIEMRALARMEITKQASKIRVRFLMQICTVMLIFHITTNQFKANVNLPLNGKTRGFYSFFYKKQ